MDLLEELLDKLIRTILTVTSVQKMEFQTKL